MCDVLWNHKSVNVRKIQINMIPGGERINHIVRVKLHSLLDSIYFTYSLVITINSIQPIIYV